MLLLLVFKAGFEILVDESMNPLSAKLKNKSCRNVAASRKADEEMKFYPSVVSKG